MEISYLLSVSLGGVLSYWEGQNNVGINLLLLVPLGVVSY
jgi:hypothetical protein